MASAMVLKQRRKGHKASPFALNLHLHFAARLRSAVGKARLRPAECAQLRGTRRREGALRPSASEISTCPRPEDGVWYASTKAGCPSTSTTSKRSGTTGKGGGDTESGRLLPQLPKSPPNDFAFLEGNYGPIVMRRIMRSMPAQVQTS